MVIQSKNVLTSAYCKFRSEFKHLISHLNRASVYKRTSQREAIKKGYIRLSPKPKLSFAICYDICEGNWGDAPWVLMCGGYPDYVSLARENLANSYPVIMPYKVINHLISTVYNIYGIITGPLTAYYLCAKCIS